MVNHVPKEHHHQHKPELRERHLELRVLQQYRRQQCGRAATPNSSDYSSAVKETAVGLLGSERNDVGHLLAFALGDGVRGGDGQAGGEYRDGDG